MKTVLSAAVFATALCSQPANAAMHVFEFSAAVRSMGTIYDDVPVPAEFDGWDRTQKRVINVGDKIVGRFTFEDSRAPWAFAGSTKNFAESSLYLNSFSFSLPENGLAVKDSRATMTGFRTDSQHRLETWFMDEDDIVSGQIYLNTPATASQPYAIRFDPTVNTNSLVLRWWTARDEYGLRAEITGFTEVSAVPEPSTYAMLIAGLGLVGGVARRRRQRSAALAG